MTINLASQRDTGLFIISQFQRSEFTNESHWPEIKMPAGMQAGLSGAGVGEDALCGSCVPSSVMPSSPINVSLPPPCCLLSLPPLLPFFPTYTKHIWMVPDDPLVPESAD